MTKKNSGASFFLMSWFFSRVLPKESSPFLAQTFVCHLPLQGNAMEVAKPNSPKRTGLFWENPRKKGPIQSMGQWTSFYDWPPCITTLLSMDSFRKRALKMGLLGIVPLFITKNHFKRRAFSNPKKKATQSSPSHHPLALSAEG